MVEQELTEEQLEEIQDLQEEMAEDQLDDQMQNSQEFQDSYGAPEPEEKQNQHSLMHKAAFASGDTVRTTFLHQEELGRPLFSVRFLLDLEDISKFYLDHYIKLWGVENRVADYFKQKIHNITDSGMSNDGFLMKLNVTKKIDSVRQKVRGNIENLKGGQQNKRK
ncbi:hypothetical protein LCGC14_0476580 [marine sediment metagenome]|uniref:Uncharacterized protein n=1 Tax=marine sediment metagenome TaxID=412755 RepID=A0A0F9SAN0_9ZZZZ|nr:hypothetical protein [bacterium]